MENQEKEITTNLDDKKVPNPTGKGGFGDHPEHISPGGWSKENTFYWWFNNFKRMTIDEFKKFIADTPEDKMTMACAGAAARVKNMIKDVGEFNIVANRTEGMPKQSIEMGVDETIGDIEVKITRNDKPQT